MKRRIAVLAMGCVPLLLGVARGAESISEEDVAVFRAVMQQTCRASDAHRELISDTPVDFPYFANSHGELEDTRFGIRLAHRVPGGARWPHIDVCIAQRVVDGDAIEDTFARDPRIPPGWDNFHADFPDAHGFAQISLPAYSSDGKRAVVLTAYASGLLSGAGFYVELRKTRRGWKIRRHEGAWIA
jgi:hypothetical protein